MLFRIGALKNIANLRRKTPVLESLFNKVAGLREKKDSKTGPVKFAKFFRASLIWNTSGRCFLRLATVTICSKIF